MSTKGLYPIGTSVRALKDSDWSHDPHGMGIPVFQKGDQGTIVDHCGDVTGQDYYIRWDSQKVTVEDGTWYAYKHEVEALA